MNCFQWQSQCSDYLDGTLSDAVQAAADTHVKTCKNCHEAEKRYRVILSTISNQPTLPLPESLKKAPYQAVIPRLHGSKISFSRWERLPWYLRTSLEGVGIVLFILIGISSAPKIRALYEQKIEKSLSDFRETLMSRDSHTEHVGDIPPLQNYSTLLAGQIRPASDELSGEADDEETTTPKEIATSGRSQLWRFTLKTVSPDEIRPQVVKGLTALGVSPSTQGLGGIQVPGGIEFDLELPNPLISKVQETLQKLDKSGSPDTFSWYRVPYKRKIPEGKSKVIIWLSQPN